MGFFFVVAWRWDREGIGTGIGTGTGLDLRDTSHQNDDFYSFLMEYL
jgi:hypothetical protein